MSKRLKKCLYNTSTSTVLTLNSSGFRYFCAMRKLLMIIVLCLTFAAFIGCDRHKGGQKWSPVDALFDSLSAVIEHDFYADSPLSRVSAEIAHLESVMPADNPAAKVRVNYWRGYLNKSMGRSNTAISFFDSAWTLANDNKLEYETHLARARILSNRDKDQISASDYLEARSLLDYFDKIGDTLSMATTLSFLGSALLELNQANESLSLYEQSRCLFDSLGYHNSASKMALNISNALLYTNKRDDAVKLLRTLENDTTLHHDPAFMEVLWRNLYLQTGDTNALNKGYELVDELPGRRDLRALYNSFKMHVSDNVKYRCLLLKDFSAVENPGWRTNISETMRNYWQSKHNADSALAWADSVIVNMELYNAQNRAAEIHSIDTRREIELLEMKHDEETRRLFILFIVILMSLAVLCLSVVIFFSKKRNKARLRQKESELRLEKSMNRIAAAAVEMETRDHILQRLEHDIEQLHRDEKLNLPDAKALTSLIRSTLRTDEEWQEFKRNYLNLSPEFFATLRAIWPGLSQNQQNMLAYIRMGLNSKQIARILMVRPESIHQSRWRLSRRLGLDPGETIEQRLSSIFDGPLLRRHPVKPD